MSIGAQTTCSLILTSLALILHMQASTSNTTLLPVSSNSPPAGELDMAGQTQTASQALTA